MSVKHVTSSVLGVDFKNTSTGALFALGSKVIGSDFSEWVYAYATCSLTTGQLCVIKAYGTAYPADQADTQSAYCTFGFPQCNFTAADYGWLAQRGGEGAGGPMVISVSGSATAAVALYISAVSGNISTITGTGGNNITLQGVQLITGSFTSTSQTANGILTYPRIATGNVGS